jgi:hypothetical protein
LSSVDLLQFVIALFYVFLSLTIAYQTGNLQTFEQAVLSPKSDSFEYWHISQVMTGDVVEVNNQFVGLRPFLYPLYLVLTLHISPYVYLMVQLLLLALSSVLLSKSAYELTLSKLSILLVHVFTLSSVTLLMSPYQVMSETLAFSLVCAFVYLYCCYVKKQEQSYLLASFFVLGLAVCVKAIFLPFWLFFALYIYSQLPRKLLSREFWVYMFCMLPLIVQLVFSKLLTGVASISTAGAYNFSWRLFPFVYGVAEQAEPLHYSSQEALAAVSDFSTKGSQVFYMLEHWRASLASFLFLCKDNYLRGGIWIGSSLNPIYVGSLQDQIWQVTKVVNQLVMYVLIISVPISMIIFLLPKCRKYKVHVFLAFMFVAFINLLSALVYYQSDRIVLVAMPVYSVCISVLIVSSWCFFKEKEQLWK